MTTNISKKRKVCSGRLASLAKHYSYRECGSRSTVVLALSTARTVSEQIFCACLQFVADGVFYAELNELLTRELAEHGYSGVEVRVTPMRTEIIIRATRTQNVLGASPVHDGAPRRVWVIYQMTLPSAGVCCSLLCYTHAA